MTYGEACSTCGGTGYLLDQTYGQVSLPAGWTFVQACDDCCVLIDDEQAAKAAAEAKGVVARYFDAIPSDDDDEVPPGDWAINWSEP